MLGAWLAVSAWAIGCEDIHQMLVLGIPPEIVGDTLLMHVPVRSPVDCPDVAAAIRGWFADPERTPDVAPTDGVGGVVVPAPPAGSLVLSSHGGRVPIDAEGRFTVARCPRGCMLQIVAPDGRLSSAQSYGGIDGDVGLRLSGDLR